MIEMEKNYVSISILRLSLRSFSTFFFISNHPHSFESMSFYLNLSLISSDSNRYAVFHFTQQKLIINIISLRYLATMN